VKDDFIIRGDGMRQQFEEQTTIFFSIMRWTILAVIIGILVGLSTTLFLKLLASTILFAKGYSYYFISIPLVFVLSTFLTEKLSPQSKGHGTEKVIEAVHRRAGRMNTMVVPVKLVTTILTLASGGSVGKEGPCGQIGAALASAFSDLFKLKDDDRRKLVICGISGGFAAVFGTPIAGAIFGLEVLYVGAVLYDVMLPSFISGIVAYEVCSNFGITYFHQKLNFVHSFSDSFFGIVLGSAVLFGLISFVFIEMFRIGERWIERWQLNIYLKNFFGGVVVVVLMILCSTKYSGLGLSYMEQQLTNQQSAAWYDFLLKMIFTTLALNFGGSGGIITPIFFIGAASGSLLATLFYLDNATFAAIGMVSLLSGCANTPIAASILAMEMFGPAIAPYAAISCVISFLMTGHRSIYPSQILSMKKTSSININLGQQIHDAEPTVDLRVRYQIYRFWKLFKFRRSK